jgi:hypothetical protein
MKFPQYDNRPGKNKPLYANSNTGKKPAKFSIVVLSMIFGVMAAIYLISHGMLDTLRSMFN